jgi:predicted nuclease of predicted toxin-antitoxin system
MASAAPDDSVEFLRVLLDEGVSPNIVTRLWKAHIDAVPLRNRSKLHAPDHQVMRTAIKEDRAVVTINEGDFTKIGARIETHPGILVIPSGGSRDEQADYIIALGDWARRNPSPMHAFRDRVTEISEKGMISSKTCCSNSGNVVLFWPARA